MKQVLLAINGDIPSKKTFQYAVELSKRIRAELSILRFIEKDKLATYFKTTCKKAVHLSRFLEVSFSDVALAEEGIDLNAENVLEGMSDPLTDMLTDTRTDVPLKVSVSGGDPERNLGIFVELHHDVVLTILDTFKEPELSKIKKTRIEKLKKQLGVPLVVVKS